ncbi:IPT/TIG domain-containing protein [Zunongwangia endophytica]|uniref:IPT/TIG domain-containing protein n=1 Tax=Zunongwangia endophytica TaxID=1808945 RepID=A0ABV8H569_9FLAO|nr:IPT/TIG domain-containing protein [Zunongwangia endophytica]MDN3595323.1 hypothetical protein [Zunongwangia endophytica]
MSITKIHPNQLKDIPSYPEPYVTSLSETSSIPDLTKDITVYGDYFTPNMTVNILDNTVSDFRFISSKEISFKVRSGNQEGAFNIILNNGRILTLTNYWVVSLGEVLVPQVDDWTNLINNPILSIGGIKKDIENSLVSADWVNIDANQDFSIYGKLEDFTLGGSTATSGNVTQIQLLNADTLNEVSRMVWRFNSSFTFKQIRSYLADGSSSGDGDGGDIFNDVGRLSRIGESWIFYVNDIQEHIYNSAGYTGALLVRVSAYNSGLKQIKLIKH